MKCKKRSAGELKSSGIEWIGEMPTTWDLKKIKQETSVHGRIGWQGLTTDEYTDVGPLLVTGTDFENGKINWQTCVHVDADRYDEDPYIQLKKKDLLVTKDGTIGKIAIIDNPPEPATLNSGVFVVRSVGKTKIEFLYWVLNSSIFTDFIDYIKTGSTIHHLFQETFEIFKFPFVPVDEQITIIPLLDSETTQIDLIIEEKHRQNELLREYEKSLIHKAVTKGIDPKAKMKDSGITWVGETPTTYRISKLKKIAKYLNGLPFKPSEWKDEGTPIIRIQNLTDENGSFNYYDGEFEEEYRVVKGDLLISWSATIGIFRWTRAPAVLNQHIFKVTTNSNVDNQFYFYLVSAALAEMTSKTHGSTMTHIVDKHFRNFYVPLPPTIKEQHQIADFLDSETTKIHEAISHIENEIGKLEEYRKSLIYEVITGKVKVVN